VTADPKVSPRWKGRLPISGTYREEWGLLEDADGTYLCEVQNVSGKLFSHIVRCVNAHDGLVEAVQRAYDVETSVTQGVEKVLREGYRELLRAALAAAKEGA